MNKNIILAVEALGMISSMADTAEGNAALMRCHYDGFGVSNYLQPFSPEPQIVAEINQYKNIGGLDLLMRLSVDAVKDIKDQCPDLSLNNVPIIVCLPSLERFASYSYEGFESDYFSRLLSTLKVDSQHPGSSYVFGGRTGIIHMLKHAQTLVNNDSCKQVLLIIADSYLNSDSFSYFSGDIYNNGRRLIGDEFSNGFVPGEAAVAVLLGNPGTSFTQTCITGLGLGEEPSIIGSGEVLRADGLSEAIRQASASSATPVCETDFRISSANGEEYWFREASLAQSRTLEKKRPSHPLWHPADSIGEVGAAVGGAMIVMAHYAFEKGYAPGSAALCQISNDNSERGAFILERVEAV
ncbi:hypothetical protein TDB9533_00850 [Thalassocella blandensis]|nr:hypothetical protein TDB9533_00850 [Thalassocella blandensis]